MFPTLDVSEFFPVHLIAGGLSRLWVVDIDGHSLVPNLDVRGMQPSCPITLSPPESPVLLGDGFVYEETEILTWLKEHEKAPCTNAALQCRWVLRLAPLRDAIEKFLSANDLSKGCDYKQIELALREAEKSQAPLGKYLERLDDYIGCCEEKVDSFAQQLAQARSTREHLIRQIDLERKLAAEKIQAATRAWQKRSMFKLMSEVLRRWKFSLEKNASAKIIQLWWRSLHKIALQRVLNACSIVPMMRRTSGDFSGASLPLDDFASVGLDALEEEAAWFRQERLRRRSASSGKWIDEHISSQGSFYQTERSSTSLCSNYHHRKLHLRNDLETSDGSDSEDDAQWFHRERLRRKSCSKSSHANSYGQDEEGAHVAMGDCSVSARAHGLDRDGSDSEEETQPLQQDRMRSWSGLIPCDNESQHNAFLGRMNLSTADGPLLSDETDDPSRGEQTSSGNDSDGIRVQYLQAETRRRLTWMQLAGSRMDAG